MSFLGILSLLQIWFLPGLIFVFLLPRLSWIDRILLSFPLSLTLNYLAVTSLTLLGFYNQQVMLSLVVCELLLLFMIGLRVGVFGEIRASLRVVNNGGVNIPLSGTNIAVLLIFILFFQNFSFQSVFQEWDAVVSYNRWAMDWARGDFPQYTWRYPQLLPIIYSITYVMIGSHQVQFFATASTVIFPLGILVLFIRSFKFVEVNSVVVKLALVFTVFLIAKIIKLRLLFSGMTEIPLIYFSLFCGYILLLMRELKTINYPFVLLVGFSVAAAGIAKQSGVFIVFAFLILVVLFVKNNRAGDFSHWHLFILSLTMVLIISPWYAYKQFEIHAALDGSELPYMVSQAAQTGLLDKLKKGVDVFGSLGVVIWPLFLLGLRNSVCRTLALIFVIPYWAIWALLFSYDHRNFAVVIPGFAVIVAQGAEYLRSWIRVKNRRDLTQRVLRVLLPVAALSLFSMLVMSVIKDSQSTRLLNKSLKSQRSIGEEIVNFHLYSYFQLHPSDGMIATEYLYLKYLPDLGHRYKGSSCDDGDPSSLEKVYFVLVAPWCSGLAQEARMEVMRASGTSDLIFEAEGYRFYKVR